MTKAKRTRKFAQVKRMLNPNKDERIVHSVKQQMLDERQKKKDEAKKDFEGQRVKEAEKVSSAMFLHYNTALGPPYRILIDTNFINFSITNKLDLIQASMDCLLAKCIPMITDCVIAELEKLGPKYRVALRIAKDPRFERIRCTHKGTYADDCIVKHAAQFKCYIVATCDKDLRRRIRKIPGVPIMYISAHKYTIEKFADLTGLKVK